jgi:hypothetical protein
MEKNILEHNLEEELQQILEKVDCGHETALFVLMDHMQTIYPIETARIATHIQNCTHFSRAAINKAICYKYRCLEYCGMFDDIDECMNNVIHVQEITDRIDAVIVWMPLCEEPSKLPSRYLDTHIDFNVDDVDIEEQTQIMENILKSFVAI